MSSPEIFELATNRSTSASSNDGKPARPTAPKVRRWDEQRWVLDNIIQANGVDWDQARTAVLLASCGTQIIADVSELREKVQKFADITPAFESLARRRQAKALAAEQNGECITAREQYYFATQYWAYTQWALDEADAQNMAFNQHKRDAMNKYANYADHHVEYVWIPFQGQKLPAVWHLPPGYRGGRVPTIVTIPGMDAYKERQVALYGDPWLNRGYAVLALEGPGYWESPLLGVYLTVPGWEETGREVMRWLMARSEVDADRIGVVGSSLGSFLTAIMLSAEPRYIAGAVSATCYEPGFTTLFGDASPSFKKRFMFMAGYTDEVAFDEFSKTMTWEGCAANVQSPFLVIAGEADELCPLKYTKQFIGALPGQKQLVIYQGSRHVVGNVPSTNLGPAPSSLEADWMAARLNGKSFSSEQWYVHADGHVEHTPL